MVVDFGAVNSCGIFTGKLLRKGLFFYIMYAHIISASQLEVPHYTLVYPRLVLVLPWTHKATLFDI